MSKRRGCHGEDDIIVVSSATTPIPLYTALYRNIASSWNISQLNQIETSNTQNFLRCVIFDSEDARVCESDITRLRRDFSKCFIIIYQPSAVNGTFFAYSYAAYTYMLMHCSVYVLYASHAYLLSFHLYMCM